MKKYLMKIYLDGDYYKTYYYYVIAVSLKQAEYFLRQHLGMHFNLRGYDLYKADAKDKVGDVKESVW